MDMLQYWIPAGATTGSFPVILASDFVMPSVSGWNELHFYLLFFFHGFRIEINAANK